MAWSTLRQTFAKNVSYSFSFELAFCLQESVSLLYLFWQQICWQWLLWRFLSPHVGFPQEQVWYLSLHWYPASRNPVHVSIGHPAGVPRTEKQSPDRGCFPLHLPRCTWHQAPRCKSPRRLQDYRWLDWYEPWRSLRNHRVCWCFREMQEREKLVLSVRVIETNKRCIVRLQLVELDGYIANRMLISNLPIIHSFSNFIPLTLPKFGFGPWRFAPLSTSWSFPVIELLGSLSLGFGATSMCTALLLQFWLSSTRERFVIRLSAVPVRCHRIESSICCCCWGWWNSHLQQHYSFGKPNSYFVQKSTRTRQRWQNSKYRFES